MHDHTTTSTIEETHKSLITDLARAEKNLQECRLDLAAFTWISERYPDAEMVQSFRKHVFVSKAAHEDATHVRPDSAFPGEDMRVSNPTQVFYILYLEIETPFGMGRLYSSRPVNLIAGYDQFNKARGAVSLVDALRKTTVLVEGRIAQRCADLEANSAAADMIAKAATPAV